VNFANVVLVAAVHWRRPDMEEQVADSTQEIKRLQRCINDLIGVLALPATWIGSEPSQIVGNLLDGLLNMLNLDLVYVRLGRSIGEPEFLRANSTWDVMPQLQEVGEMVRSWLGDSTQNWPALTRKTFRNREISMLPLQLGLQGEIGALVAGSERADFPQQTERLVLSVAASQAAIGLKEAHLLHDQRQLARELDQRVAERTSELTTTNEELREARMALQKACDEVQREAWLSRVVDRFPTLTWTMRPDGSAEFLSKKWHEFTGMSVDEARGWGWQPAFHPDDLPALMNKWMDMLAKGEPGEKEARLRRADGVYRWFLIRAEPFRDEAGTIVRWYGNSTDIEERKRAEEALAASEQNLRLIINTMPTLAWSALADGNVDFVNRRWLDSGAGSRMGLGSGFSSRRPRPLEQLLAVDDCGWATGRD
jgi:PAS domain S-box-containing protein